MKTLPRVFEVGTASLRSIRVFELKLHGAREGHSEKRAFQTYGISRSPTTELTLGEWNLCKVLRDLHINFEEDSALQICRENLDPKIVDVDEP